MSPVTRKVADATWWCREHVPDEFWEAKRRAEAEAAEAQVRATRPPEERPAAAPVARTIKGPAQGRLL